MAVKLIIFDFDGTLGDTRHIIVTTMQMTISELHLPVRSASDCVSTIGLPLAGCFRMLYPEMQEELIQRCAETYRRLFYDNMRTIPTKPFPYVVETLASLHQAGYLLTIASSRSHKSLAELTHDMGIAGYMSFLIGADDVKLAKPEPEPVLNTLAAMHCDATQSLVVGDMAVDILMGSNAGTLTCGVTWGNGSRDELVRAGADYIIDSITDIASVLNR